MTDTPTRNGWARLTAEQAVKRFFFRCSAKGANEGDKATRQRHTEKERGRGGQEKKTGRLLDEQGCD